MSGQLEGGRRPGCSELELVGARWAGDVAVADRWVAVTVPPSAVTCSERASRGFDQPAPGHLGQQGSMASLESRSA